MTAKDFTEFDAILDAIALDATPDHDTLTRLIGQYPHWAAELTEFFAALAHQEALGGQARLDVTRFANASMRRALALYDEQVAALNALGPGGLAGLLSACGFQAVAFNCQLSVSFLRDLAAGRIDVSTVPATCIGSLAGAMQVSMETVIDALDAIAATSGGEPAPMSFSDAIRQAGLSQRAQDNWLKEVGEGCERRRV